MLQLHAYSSFWNHPANEEKTDALLGNAGFESSTLHLYFFLKLADDFRKSISSQMVFFLGGGWLKKTKQNLEVHPDFTDPRPPQNWSLGPRVVRWKRCSMCTYIIIDHMCIVLDSVYNIQKYHIHVKPCKYTHIRFRLHFYAP